MAEPRTALVADLFCGAGGSSTGARRALTALGWRMELVAVNHWDTAIETHSRNHPEARHYLKDVTAADPIQLVPEGKLDLLMASPTCTHHSRARGGKPSSDQQRMDPWAIVRWCSELRVKRLLVENVPEFVEWGPINLVTGRPLRRRKGEYFRSWVAALRGLGFKIEWRILNAADFGDATTRVRFFLMARSDGKRITWPAPTHSREGTDLLGQAVRKWRAAREIIDWSIEGQSIFDRKRPLARATLERIYAGARKFNWPSPYLVVLRQHMDAQSVDAPCPSICANGNHLALAEPCLIPTGGAHALIAPYYGSGSGATCGSVDTPLPTVTAKARFGIVVPVTNKNGGPGPRSIDEPVPTMTTARGGEFALAMPVTHGTDLGRARSIDEPLPTITGAHRGELAVIVASHGDRDGQAPRIHSVDAPAPTICASGRIQLAEAGPRWDIRFRMLQPHELAAAMGFSGDDAAYEFAGNKTEVTKQIGNAVPVNVACALVRALMA